MTSTLAPPTLSSSPSAARAASSPTPALSRAGLIFVLALHLLAFWLLLRTGVIVLPVPPAVLTVSLVAPAVVARPDPEVTPPRPRPVERRPVPRSAPQPATLALAADAPAAALLVSAPPTPAPVAVAAAPESAPPAPAAPSAPRFDADYLDNPKPVYPALSRRLGEEGKVILRVHVLADGQADEIQLHTASGSPRLDQAAQNAVRRWRFVPARRGGETLAAWVLVPIAFTLKE